ncbi:MAG: alpha/beta hydrolase [Bacteroidia bacterium]
MPKPHLILIQGYAETGFIFKHIEAELSQHYNVWIPELPGFGITKAPEVFTMEAYAQWIAAYMSDNGIDKAHLAGHSLGGYILATFGVLFPEKIEKLTLIHSHAGADGAERSKKRNDIANAIAKYGGERFLRLFYAGLFDPDAVESHQETIKKMFEHGKSMPDETLIQLQYAMQKREDRVAELAKMDFPIQFFAGRKDTLVSVEEIEKQVAQIPNASVSIQDVAHMGQFECRQKVVHFILNI